MDDISPDDLPTIAERRRLGFYVSDIENRVAERFGEDVAHRLLGTVGGQRITLPKIPTPDHELARLLGWPLLEFLCEQFGRGASVSVPVGCFSRHTQNRIRLRRAIMAMPGRSNVDIVRATGHNIRQVRRVSKYMREAGLLPPTPADNPKSAQGSPCVREAVLPAPGIGGPRDGV
jgi:hypothetical protein